MSLKRFFTCLSTVVKSTTEQGPFSSLPGASCLDPGVLLGHACPSWHQTLSMVVTRGRARRCTDRPRRPSDSSLLQPPRQAPGTQGSRRDETVFQTQTQSNQQKGWYLLFPITISVLPWLLRRSSPSVCICWPCGCYPVTCWFESCARFSIGCPCSYWPESSLPILKASSCSVTCYRYFAPLCGLLSLSLKDIPWGAGAPCFSVAQFINLCYGKRFPKLTHQF